MNIHEGKGLNVLGVSFKYTEHVLIRNIKIVHKDAIFSEFDVS